MGRKNIIHYIPVSGAQFLSVEHGLNVTVQIFHSGTNFIQRILKGEPFYFLECEKDDGILIHPFPAQLFVFGNLETSKKVPTLLCDVEE